MSTGKMEQLIRISKNKISGSVRCLEWTEGDSTILYLPAFDLSAYGYDREDALDMLDVAVQEFCENMMKEGVAKSKKYLQDLGWEPKRMFNKQMEQVFDKTKVIKLNPHIKDVNLLNEYNIAV